VKWLWPIRPRRAADELDDAVGHMADRWQGFRQSSGIAANVHLRDQLAFFAPTLEPDLQRAFLRLVHAGDEVMLLLLAQAVLQSGTHSRHQIEKALGIVLP
jgi:hypothetical protein